MNELTIQLSGKVLETNFPAWKKDLLGEIDGIQRELKSDEDFALATDQAKSLKKAEEALKKAKQSAIDQAADIQELFAAIDEIAAKARETRLSLERQVKIRKEDIKDEIVESGMRQALALVEEQNDDVRLTDTRRFTDKKLFVDAIKGKRGIHGMEAAVRDVLVELKHEIAEHTEAVDGRATRLGKVTTRHQALFQDRGALLGLAHGELEATIAQRIEVYEQALEAAGAEPEPTEETSQEEPPDVEETDGGDVARVFRVVVRVRASEEEAKGIAKEIRAGYGDRTAVLGVELEETP